MDDQAHDHGDLLREKALLYNDQLFSKASAYENIVLGVGYAGLLTLWNGVRTILPTAEVVLTVALIGTSLIFYVGWNIAQMVVRVLGIAKVGPVFASGKVGDEFTSALHAVEVQNAETSRKLIRAWPWVFGISAVTGLTAALVLIGSAAFEWVSTLGIHAPTTTFRTIAVRVVLSTASTVLFAIGAGFWVASAAIPLPAKYDGTWDGSDAYQQGLLRGLGRQGKLNRIAALATAAGVAVQAASSLLW